MCELIVLVHPDAEDGLHLEQPGLAPDEVYQSPRRLLFTIMTIYSLTVARKESHFIIILYSFMYYKSYSVFRGRNCILTLQQSFWHRLTKRVHLTF